MFDLPGRLDEVHRVGIVFFNTGSLLAADPIEQSMTLEEMRAIVDTAHALGRRAIADGHHARGIVAALRAGADIVDSVHLYDEQTFSQIGRDQFLQSHIHGVVQAVGDRITTALNGVELCQAENITNASGHIGIQGETGALEELGANDALRGVDPTETRANLDAILVRLGERGLPTLLAGMRAPRNLGSSYAESFDRIFPDLAEAHRVALYPFFLEGVALQPTLNQADGIHPNRDGVSVIVERILPHVIDLLDRVRSG